MTILEDRRPGTLVLSLLAALTTWVTLLSWSGFAERPAGFLGPLFLGCLMIAVLGMLLRSLRVPALLVVLAQVLMVGLWLQLRLASAEALGGLVPTPSSVRAVLDAFHESGLAAQGYAAPVPESVPEFYPLMILAGAATAVLVDFLAVGVRRAPLAGLPLLAVYTAPVSILNGGVAWPLFVLAALCFVFLVAADEGHRLTHWGQQLTPGGGVFDARTSAIGSGAVWGSARKIGFTATALAVFVPLFLPTFSASLFGGGGSEGGGSGDSVSISNPMVDLRRDLTRGVDVDLVKLKTSDPDPSYLRTTVLNTYDGQAWRPSARRIPARQRADGAVAPPPGLQADVQTEDFAATVEISDYFRSRWLPTPYPVSTVDAPGDWRYDLTTMDFISAADNQTTAGLSYRLRSLSLNPTAKQLADSPGPPLSVGTPNTALPKKLPASVRTLADTVTEGKSTMFEKAVALQEWFRVDGGFRYSLERSSGNGTDDLLSFLGTGEDGRVGYCEQFAAAMAVMGRTLGIPSRVAVGFLQPEKTGENTWVFSSHDLHAWPEMYFERIGWVRFEPTPQGRAGSVPAYTRQQVPTVGPEASSSAPTDVASSGPVNRPNDPQQSAGDTGGDSSFASPTRVAALVFLVVAALLLLAPRVLRSLVRRRRWTSPTDAKAWVEAGWREIRDTAVDLALPWDDHVSVRTTAAALQQSFGREGDADAYSGRPHRGPDVNPEATEALQRIVLLLERARYARALPAGATTLEAVEADVEACVEALRAGAGERRVRRAKWLPVSVLRSLGTPHLRPSPTTAAVSGPGVDRAV